MTACLVRSHCRVAGSRMVLCWAFFFFFFPCLLLSPPLISQPAPRARLCSPIYKFCAHVAEWSGVYCRGTLTVMRPHVSEPFFLRFTPTPETRIWPCLHPHAQTSPPRSARGLSCVLHGESETRNKVCVRMRADVSPAGWRGGPGHLRGVVTTSLPFFPFFFSFRVALLC